MFFLRKREPEIRRVIRKRFKKLKNKKELNIGDFMVSILYPMLLFGSIDASKIDKKVIYNYTDSSTLFELLCYLLFQIEQKCDDKDILVEIQKDLISKFIFFFSEGMNMDSNELLDVYINRLRFYYDNQESNLIFHISQIIINSLDQIPKKYYKNSTVVPVGVIINFWLTQNILNYINNISPFLVDTILTEFKCKIENN